MAVMNVQYRGEFRSIDGVLYRIDLLTADSAPSSVVELSFPADTPVEIEWHGVDKLEPVQGSCLTLRLISESDRQFVGFYSVDVGSMRCDVYRNGVLYWSGTLDTELYEEPYSTVVNYEVSFTFSDFAILERKRWELRGVCSFQSLLTTCLDALQINYLGLEQRISTALYPNGGAIDLAEIFLSCENFFDEEGEAMTMREVLDEVLRPFAMRLVQKGGRLWLYDLNAVHSGLGVEELYWKGTDALLGVDKVYNNVKLTFSPYAHTELIDGSLDPGEVLESGANARTYKMNKNWSDTADGFTLYIGDQEDLAIEKDQYSKFFRTRAIYSGDDEAGVVRVYKGNTEATLSQSLLHSVNTPLSSAGVCNSSAIITTRRAFLSHTPNSNFRLKVSLGLLFDVRYNPFESADEFNDKAAWKNLQDWCNFGYVPIKLLLRDAAGNVLYHYVNKSIMNRDGFSDTLGSWAAGEGAWGDAWLAYYDWEDRKSKSGFGGWQTNKPMLGYYRGALPKRWIARGEGEFVPLPPRAGFLELQIGSGIHQFDYKREVKDIYSKVRWLMYKEPKVTLVKGNGLDVELNDFEQQAFINSEALEELTIDTIVGTMGDKHVPSAMGCVYDSSLWPKRTFTRAGVEDSLENLLIATAYSQYATRHNVLSGTVRLLPNFALFSDASSAGLKYLLASEVQNLVLEESVMSMVELSEENYQALNSD